jgi:triacylglycerol lipase
VWPNDGLVATSSALATDISDRVLPHRRCLTFDDTHSIFVSNLAGLPWETGMTWDPRVLDAVRTAIDNADGGLQDHTRDQCPVS